ncbi:Gfo/Idh/MocA family oxidoreductase [Candidatus Kaiserbacteria bacterium]|nr:Gfo/Idh/MocA family oxidoreductase [Candidatus Kaiserbacteria bacterium]
MKVKILGAGSIGNHHAQACRAMGWDVTVVDADPKALERMKTEVYPQRYGAWDEAIQLFEAKDQPRGGFDIIYLGIPPHVRLSVALEALAEKPKVLQLEKPVCPPTAEAIAELRSFAAAAAAQPETMVVIGFNHLVAKNTETVEKAIADSNFGKLLSIESGVRSDWAGILGAHPWLTGPEETYLGYWKKGGGAGGEHSHAISLWVHFAHHCGAGAVSQVSGMIEYVTKGAAEYDRQFFAQLTTETGLVGRVVQDIVTNPKKKWIELQFEGGRIEWWNDVSKTTDEVLIQPKKGESQKIVIEKTRAEEFLREAQHIDDLITGRVQYSDSPIALAHGIETALILEAAHRSHAEGKRKTIVLF